LPPLFHLAPRWGAAGLTASAGMAGWVEFMLLRRTLNKRIGHTGLPFGLMAKLWLVALCAAALALGIKWLLGHGNPILHAFLILGPYGVTYFALTWLVGVDECRNTLSRILRRVLRR